MVILKVVILTFEDRIDGSNEFAMNPHCLEGQFSGVRQDFIANSSQAAQMLPDGNGYVRDRWEGRNDNGGAQRCRFPQAMRPGHS